MGRCKEQRACLLGLARVRDAPMQSEGRSCVPGEGHSASEPPTLSSALPPPDALPGRNATQGEEAQAEGGVKEKFFSICRVRREEEQVEGYLNKGWWGRSVTVDSRVEKVTVDLFFSRVLVPK